MSKRRHGIMASAAIAAVALGVGLGVTQHQSIAQAESSSPAPTPASTQLAKPGGISRSDPAFIAAAQRLNVTPAALGAAIGRWKMAGGAGSPAAMQVLDRRLGVTDKAARAALGGIIPFGSQVRPSGLLGDSSVRAFAIALGISNLQARGALQAAMTWPQKAGGISLTDPSFQALAGSLGVSATRLGAALDQAKMALGQK